MNQTSQSPSGLEARRREAAEALLKLVSRDELHELATRISSELSTAESVAVRMAKLPRFRALGIVLTIAEPTLRMLRDILSYLETHGVAARTTGCALLLADPVQGHEYRLDLSPQEVGAIASWTPKSRKILRDESFSEALVDWNSLRTNWERLLQAARPRTRRGNLNVVQSYITRRDVYRRDRDLTEHSAMDALRTLVTQVEHLIELLAKLPERERPRSCEVLLRDMRELTRAAQRDVLGEDAPARRGAQDGTRLVRLPLPGSQERRNLLRHVDQRFLDTFDRLAEDLYLLADLLDGGTIFDILGANIWTSRPQLYEVWLLVTILNWLEDRGYHVELLKVERAQGDSPTWRLAYARESDPCARVVGGALDDGALYYQLYRKSGGMPDLCLFPGVIDISRPLWAIDAKHSDAGSYTLATYRRTAERYQESFGARLSLVVEYFPRTDIVDPNSNPIHVRPGAIFVADAAPGCVGISLLFNVLSTIHPPVGSVVVCIDLSESFRSRMNAALGRARNDLRNERALVSDTFLCFAQNAVTRTGISAFIDGSVDTPSLPTDVVLGGDTCLGPLVAELRVLIRATPVSRILLVSDLGFSDSSEVLKTLIEEFHVPVSHLA